MANSHQGLTKAGSIWHYHLKVNGQRAHGSTRATDLATAKRILEEKRRELLEGQHRIVSKVPTLTAVFEASPPFPSGSHPPPQSGYGDSHRPGISAPSAAVNKSQMKRPSTHRVFGETHKSGYRFLS